MKKSFFCPLIIHLLLVGSRAHHSSSKIGCHYFWPGLLGNNTLVPWANWTLIILFSEMLKFSEILIFPNEKIL
jgi:hypothetical protein